MLIVSGQLISVESQLEYSLYTASPIEKSDHSVDDLFQSDISVLLSLVTEITLTLDHTESTTRVTL